MKDMKQILNNMQHSNQPMRTHEEIEAQKKAVSENAKSVVDDLFTELKACYPAWRQAFGDKSSWLAAKKTWTKAFIENGINSQEQVSTGLVCARKGDSPFWPSVGQFIRWCDGTQIDTVDAFNRMISKKPAANLAERQTRHEVGYKCKCQLAEDKARKLFSETLIRNIEKVKTGELVDKFIEQKLASPEEFKKTETVEQRNARLDREIDELLSKGFPLLGSLKKRFNER